MNKSKQILGLLLSLLFIYIMLMFTFKEATIFWYLYTFTLLIGTAIAFISGSIEDQLPTWKYLIFGIGYGTISYGIVRLGFMIFNKISDDFSHSVSKFLTTYGPENIWHYLLLILIIAVGEELFWRGFVQQKIKQFTSPAIAVIITSILFSLSIAVSGFIPGVITAFLVGLLWGALYEWKKSMPLVIVAHEVFILLLFLVLPFA